MAALGPGAAPAAEPSVKFTVAGSRRPLTWDTGPGAGVDKLFMSRADSGPYGNPFRMPRGAAGEAYRDEVCEAHTEWLRLGNVPASGIRRGPEGQPPLIMRKDGTEFSTAIELPANAHSQDRGRCFNVQYISPRWWCSSLSLAT